ncbi:MAG: hypothetical protein KBC69_00945 [Candidatus Magasanikbacteria bacterium]|nr:hypothetical protein [Candidatus Magasanikbacteria bacterium]
MSKKVYIFLVLLAGVVLTGAGCIQFTGSAQGPMGIFVSQDSAETWQQKNVLLTAQGLKNLSGAKVYKIFTDPSDSKALYMGTRGQGLYYSYDNAETWNSSPTFVNKYIYALTVDPNDKCTIYASDGPTIYKTTDCQRNWKPVFNEGRPAQRIAALASDPKDSKIIYAAEIGGDILKSKDAGQSWRAIKSFNFELRHLVVDPFNANRLYLASYGQGLYRSDDGGETWATANSGFENFSGSLSFYRLVLNPVQQNNLFWISKYGILRSDDGGNSWSEIKLLTPPGSVNIYAFAVNPKNLSEMYYTGTILGDQNQNVRSTLYKTVDGGVNWVTKKLPTNTIPVDLLINKENGKNIFLGFTTL